MFQKIKSIFCNHKFEIVESEYASIFGIYASKLGYCTKCGNIKRIGGEWVEVYASNLTQDEGNDPKPTQMATHKNKSLSEA